MSDRKLVITADDFGYDPGTNECIVGLLHDGLVTATTLLTVSEFAASAVALLADYPAAVGVHFTLNSEKGREPWSPLAVGSGLGADGVFLDSPGQAETQADSGQVTAELEAQFQAAVDLGVAPARLDSHAGSLYGLHGKPFIGQALQVCARRGVGFRLPRSLTMFFGDNVPEPMVALHQQAVYGADALSVPLPTEMATNPFPTADIGSYEALRDYYVGLLPQFPEGTSELFLHPSEDTSWARERFGADWDKRVWESRLLRDPAWGRALKKANIDLVATW